ncbi:MAG: isoaspartyl peptidase/L-asparaginase [Halobacteriales archaeon]|nr:isoaspartyl peptidase/L-asparaginase [Halobacteriales archaeon]
MQLIVHGGAGSDPDEPDARQAVLDEAAAAGAAEPTPLDAVVAAVAGLEASPRFNAGRGGAVQADGAVRTDAGVMTGDRAVGAVCAVPGVLHAAAAARAVLERTPHVLVSGDEAAALAAQAGVETGRDLLTDDTRARFEDAAAPTDDLAATIDWVRERFGEPDHAPGNDHDTVGAVAVAEDGRLAAATSTGGRWFALPGRVGDTPQVGAGFYASAAGGASATGWGEDIARVTMSREAVRRLEGGEAPQAAAEAAVERFEAETGGDAGIILADREGRVGSAFNTALMQTAAADR